MNAVNGLVTVLLGIALALVSPALPAGSADGHLQHVPAVQTLTVYTTAVLPPVERDGYEVVVLELGDPARPWTLDVALRGHQREIDWCVGPVLSIYEGYGSVIGEHNHCGGAYVLDIALGDTVVITGLVAGTYVVTGIKDVPKGSSADVLDFAPLYLQTCYFGSNLMRLVGLAPAGK